VFQTIGVLGIQLLPPYTAMRTSLYATLGNTIRVIKHLALLAFKNHVPPCYFGDYLTSDNVH
jgi:hypothetical protein